MRTWRSLGTGFQGGFKTEELRDEVMEKLRDGEGGRWRKRGSAGVGWEGQGRVSIIDGAKNHVCKRTAEAERFKSRGRRSKKGRSWGAIVLEGLIFELVVEIGGPNSQPFQSDTVGHGIRLQHLQEQSPQDAR